MMRQPYRKRDKRQKNPKRIRITPRDIDVLKSLEQFDYLTTSQIHQLHFDTLDYAYERMAQLYDNGYVQRFLPHDGLASMNTPIVYVIDRKGVEALSKIDTHVVPSEYAYVKSLKPLFIDHTIAVNDVRITITKACFDKNVVLAQWIGERELKSDHDSVAVADANNQYDLITVIPDSFFVIHVNGNAGAFCLEVDRGTMTLKRFAKKVKAYIAYYQSGLYTKRFNTTMMRVLTVTTSETRLNNLLDVTEKVGGGNRFWFTTFEELMVNHALMATIWRRATMSASFHLLG